MNLNTFVSHVSASDMPDLNASSDDIVLMASVEEMEKRCHLMIAGREF